MPKGQLSRVPWPGNSWMPFTFQPALQAPQQPHKHSNSLQQAIHSLIAHHYIQQTLLTLSVFFFPKGFFKVPCGHIKVTCPPSVAAMGKCKQINNSPYVSDISLIIHERNYAISSMPCFLP